LSKVDQTSRQPLQCSKVWQPCCCHGSSLRLLLRCCYSRLLRLDLRLGCWHLLLLLVLLHVGQQHLDLLWGSTSSAGCLQQLLQRCCRHLS
jgi:hypothetical protein